MSQQKHIRRSKYGREFIAGRRKRIWYPSVGYIIEVNDWVVKNIPRPKAKRHEVYSEEKIKRVIENAKSKKGSLNEKAAVLFGGINRGHQFASGNKSTGYLVACKFLFINRGHIKLKKNDIGAKRFIYGVREGRYGDKKIARWLDE